MTSMQNREYKRKYRLYVQIITINYPYIDTYVHIGRMLWFITFLFPNIFILWKNMRFIDCIIWFIIFFGDDFERVLFLNIPMLRLRKWKCCMYIIYILCLLPSQGCVCVCVCVCLCMCVCVCSCIHWELFIKCCKSVINNPSKLRTTTIII